MQIDQQPALFALTEHESSYRLAIAQTSGTFQVQLSLQDLPHEGVEFLKRQLFEKDPAYTTRYESSPDSIKMQISQQLSSGIVRQIWETTLLRAGTLFGFTEQLLQFQQHGQTSGEKLQTTLRQIEHDREEWKRTAQQLEHVWQTEKSELLDNFLVLYHHQKERTTKAQERIHELEQLLQEKEQELTNVKNNNKSDDHRILLQNEPDDMDTELYPQELVDRLAGGKKVKKRPATTTTKAVVPKKRRNQATGAMEYFDADEAVTDLILQTEQKNSDAKENPLESERKNDSKKARGKNAKDDSSTDSAGNYSYSSELDSDILAQLAAMKKRGD
ncbi:hypothetical protein FisN_11Hh231 [Fistulifera solaris]|jgi:hypothetical protein|uniref:Uncharacterized protein n=1 Tax=Fistulifera solaris TaxID=1519565 RepID=A0A1Z5JKZ8_FISSO|nr:hypothetical protein FisN_11Hh231 [Fistulifera solaris]|eukprot:GAX14690.1 hypothetical protein FisN_11Hh231 [Fistulifera solaris]